MVPFIHKQTSVQGGVSTSGHPHIDALIKSQGHIMIGAIKPVRNAAVAYDGQQAVAMLRYQADEPLASILPRSPCDTIKRKRIGH